MVGGGGRPGSSTSSGSGTGFLLCMLAVAAASSMGTLGIITALSRSKATRGSHGGIANRPEEEEDELWAIEEVLSLWFDGDTTENYHNKWFAPPGSVEQEAIDRHVRERFTTVLAKAEKGGLASWRRNPRGYLALIVLLDQLGRHVYREDTSRPVKIEAINQLTLEYSMDVMSKGWEKTLSIPQHIFLLMPFRHSATIDRLKMVLSEIDHRAEEETRLNDLLLKFRKTTLRRLQVLQDKPDEHDDILEHLSFQADETRLPNHRVSLAMLSFLRRHVEGKGVKAVGVSLSGGVDSMVIAKLLVHYKAKFGYEVVALHIDYGNRAESGHEADYVETWCHGLGIVFRKRTIREVTRGVTARDDYERISREIRFGFYTQVMEETGCPAIMLGHHKGDVQENVVSNAMKGCSPICLSGMDEYSVVNGVMVWRPLLTELKQAIFDFAHTYGVPYFKDTTPSWSTRGKLRRQLWPLLSDMYGDGFKQNLSTLASQSDQLRSLVYTNVFDPFWKSVTIAPLAAYFDATPHLHQGPFFWREAIRKIVHDFGAGMISDKGILDLLKRLHESKLPKHQSGGKATFWVPVKREYCLYTDGRQLFIFRPHVMTGSDLRDGDSELGNGPCTPIPLEEEVMIGNWRVVTAVVVVEDESTVEELYNRPVFTTMEEFCQGRFSHHVRLERCMSCGRAMVLQARQDRHRKLVAWRYVGIKLRRALPVVRAVCGVCEGGGVVVEGPTDGGGGNQPCLVEVRYEYVMPPHEGKH